MHIARGRPSRLFFWSPDGWVGALSLLWYVSAPARISSQTREVNRVVSQALHKEYRSGNVKSV